MFRNRNTGERERDNNAYDAKALARHIMRMDFGTETELYLYADADGKWVECAAALRKERWKDTEYCLLGGYGLPVKASTSNADAALPT